MNQFRFSIRAILTTEPFIGKHERIERTTFSIRASLSTASEQGERVMSHSSSSMASDPRQPSAARQYIPPVVSPQDLPIDYAGFIAVIFGVMGVMLRYKLCSWLALIFCSQSLANMKNMETDLKQMSMAFMFAVMGLVTNYLNASRQSSGK